MTIVQAEPGVFNFLVDIAECQAARLGLHAAIEFGLKKVILEDEIYAFGNSVVLLFMIVRN